MSDSTKTTPASPLRHGQPRTYWVFRNFATIIQVLVAVGLIGWAVLWALTDRHWYHVWMGFADFANQLDLLAHSLPYPWQVG